MRDRRPVRARASPAALSPSLRLLDDAGPARPDLVEALVTELFAAALGLSPEHASARRILRRADGAMLADRLPGLVRPALADRAMEREEFRALAMLLEDLRRFDLLDELKAVAAGSPDADIRIVAEDFPEYDPSG